jgi:acetylglutamate kinase
MDKLYVIKIGGNIIDDEQKLSSFLQSFAEIEGRKILVHGGGKLATRLAEQMNIPQQMVDGRRITDAETLKIVTMVYGGYINKNIVAALQSLDCYAIGLTGADGNVIKAHKRTQPGTDYGFVGDVDAVNVYFLYSLLEQDITPVISPITHDGKGQLLNTNADTIAQEIAQAMSIFYEVSLVYSFEKEGVMKDIDDDNSVIAGISKSYYEELKSSGVISAGMIPKLHNAFAAIDKGVKKVIIGKAERLHQLVEGTAGTTVA